MVTLKVRRAESWEEIERAASKEIAETCIGPNMANLEGAKLTWDMHAIGDNPNVIYFIISATEQIHESDQSSSDVVKGYIRLHKATYASDLPTTWVIDYIKPLQYTSVIQVASLVPGTILVRRFNTQDDIFTRGWPKITLGFPRLDEYPYHLKISRETEYLVVPKFP